MKMIIFVSLVLCSLNLQAADKTHYSTEEIAELSSGSLKGERLLEYVDKVAQKSFRPLGYKRGAKPALFKEIDLQRDSKGYFIKDVYCNYKIRNRVGPKKIPSNNIMNAEHTWPQSKGSRREPFRGDLHHLFPTDSKANSTRGNYPFGEVEGRDVSKTCTASQVGKMIHPVSGELTSKRAYQPPVEHRGNVARALFYSAAAYGYKITNMQEVYLKKWHKEDPVDADEVERNDQVQAAQGNRNPFIDFPELVERIENF